MQTFVPYSDIKKIVKCLDYRRLGKLKKEFLNNYIILFLIDYYLLGVKLWQYGML